MIIKKKEEKYQLAVISVQVDYLLSGKSFTDILMASGDDVDRADVLYVSSTTFVFALIDCRGL